MDVKKIYLSSFNSDGSETVAYNNPLFPIYIQNGILSVFPDYTFITHWHQDLEFVVMLDGNMTYNVNGQLIDLKEDEGIMVNSRQLHSCFSKEKKECHYICIVFSLELFHSNKWFYENYIEPFVNNDQIPYLKLTPTDWQNEVINELKEVAKTRDSFSIMSHLYQMMGILNKNLLTYKTQSLKNENELNTLKRMLYFIDENSSHQINLSDIANAGSCCQSKCFMLFKKYLHDTPTIYLTKLRLRKSLTDLLKTDETITTIATKYGFNSSSYYSELFHKYYGTSPLQYRKNKKYSQI